VDTEFNADGNGNLYTDEYSNVHQYSAAYQHAITHRVTYTAPDPCPVKHTVPDLHAYPASSHANTYGDRDTNSDPTSNVHTVTKWVANISITGESQWIIKIIHSHLPS
jgi:hypothetical protein